MVKVRSSDLVLNNTLTPPLTQQKKMGITGSIGMWLGSSPPPGALLCDGASHPTASYPLLAASLGASGATFLVPNLQGRLPRGTNLNDRVPGGTPQIQSIDHQHEVDQSRFRFVFNGSRPEIGNGSWSEQFTSQLSTNVTTTNNASGAKIDYLPLYLAVNFIIYT
jgi:hypothetical protein